MNNKNGRDDATRHHRSIRTPPRDVSLHLSPSRSAFFFVFLFSLLKSSPGGFFASDPCGGVVRECAFFYPRAAVYALFACQRRYFARFFDGHCPFKRSKEEVFCVFPPPRLESPPPRYLNRNAHRKSKILCGNRITPEPIKKFEAESGGTEQAVRAVYSPEKRSFFCFFSLVNTKQKRFASFFAPPLPHTQHQHTQNQHTQNPHT